MDKPALDTYPPTLYAGYFDENNPLSLHSKLGPEWSKRLIGALADLPEAGTMLHDETMLKTWLYKEHQFRGTVTENRYRYQFWLEYEASVREARLMRVSNVYTFIGAESTFHKLVCADPRRIAWMLCRPMAYEVSAREMLIHGLGRMREYLEKDPFENPAKPNMKLMELQLKITQMMDLRLHGAPTQKVQNLNLTASLGGNGDEVKKIVESGDMRGIQQKLEDLRARKRKAEGRGAEPPLAEGETAADRSEIIEAEVVQAAPRERNV